MTSTVATGYPSEHAVEVEFQHPDRTSRLLLLFRVFIAIPQFLFAIGVMIIAVVLILANYLAVLVTGRAAFSGFLSGALRYMTRLTSYMYFLTDAYPPFSLAADPGYPVQVTIEKPGKIHRWRVFSYFLAAPHIIVLYVLLIAAALTSFVSWVIILITGRYPTALYSVATAAVRYQTRVNAYLYLIVDRYPPFTLN
jgi:hypothetical protein